MNSAEAGKAAVLSVSKDFTSVCGGPGSAAGGPRSVTMPKSRARSGWVRTALLTLAVCVAYAAVGGRRAAAQSAATESTLYAFCAQGTTTCPDGSDPYGGLILASDGNFYGTTVGGGSNGNGTFFKITPSGTLTTLYNFCASGCTIGGQPETHLVEGSDGNFYGTSSGGTYNGGVVYRITPSGQVTALYNFCSQTSCADGNRPMGSLVLGKDGNFYGVTYDGGNETNVNTGGGTIFKISPSGQLTTIYSFCSQATCPDGYGPIGTLVQGSDGDFYGMTAYGGANSPPTSNTANGGGTIFKITPSGQLTTLYSFCSNYNAQTGICTDGSLDYPSSHDGLIEGNDGNLYGTTFYGGNGSGTIFRITPSGTYTVLHDFCSLKNCPDGSLPMDSLLQGSDGNFYGVTWYGGTFYYTGYTAGIAYQMTPSGAFTVLHQFCSQGGSACTDGAMPQSTLVQGNNGDLYGPTPFGGIVNSGGGSGGILYDLSLNPALSAPVQLSFSSGQLNLGNSATLSWKVLNGASTTMQQCYAFVQNNATGAGTWTGLQTGTVNGGVYSGSSTITPTADGTYTYALTCGGTESGFATLTVGGVAPLTISTTNLPAATVGAGYSQTLVATGGATPYIWSISSASGSLPAGLSLNSSTGAITGTPTTAGTSNFTVQVKDSESTPASTTTSLSITVNPVALAISTSALPAGTAGTAYSATLAASGGVAPYIWSLTSGSLPAGLSLNSSTGAITGTPTTAGISSFTVQVTDSESTPASTTANLSITVNAAVAPGYSLSANPDTLNIVAGQSGTTVITLTPVGGFSGAVSLSCSGLPSYASCSFNPTSLSPNGSNKNVTTTLTIATDVSTTASLRGAPADIPPVGSPAPLLAAVSVGCLALLFGFHRRIAATRRLRSGLLVLLLGIGCLTMTLSCGGNSVSSGGSSAVTPAGTSTVVVTASAGTGSSAQNLNLTVTITQ